MKNGVEESMNFTRFGQQVANLKKKSRPVMGDDLDLELKHGLNAPLLAS